MASIRLKNSLVYQQGLQGAEFRTLGRTHGYRWWKTADFSHSACTAHSEPPNIGLHLAHRCMGLLGVE